MRDVYTFTAAMRIAGCAGVLLQQQEEEMREHGTAVFQGDLPPNLRLAFHVDGGLETFLKFIADAKLVVIPRFRDDIGCTGISTYLMAMGLGKCVILSRGPGAEDLLTQEAVLVEPENVTELAQAISQLWNDDVRRNRVAAAGQKYADSCQASDRLRSDILKSSLLCLGRPNFHGQ
jgi:glycosyltransferase involved in cell wall biosynthesis